MLLIQTIDRTQQIGATRVKICFGRRIHFTVRHKDTNLFRELVKSGKTILSIFGSRTVKDKPVATYFEVTSIREPIPNIHKSSYWGLPKIKAKGNILDNLQLLLKMKQQTLGS